MNLSPLELWFLFFLLLAFWFGTPILLWTKGGHKVASVVVFLLITVVTVALAYHALLDFCQASPGYVC